MTGTADFNTAKARAHARMAGEGETSTADPAGNGNGGAGTAGNSGAAHGQSQQQKAKTAKGDDWPDPGELGAPPPAPLFPVELLPADLGDWVVSQATTMGIPYDVLATPSTACIAGCIGRDAVLQVKRYDRSWLERPCIWNAIIMPKGSGKTPAIKAAAAPLYEIQANSRRQWEEDIKNWEERQKRTKGGKIKHDPKDPRPKEPKLVIMDITQESAADVMVNSRGLTMVRDELSGLIANMSRYTKGSDRPFYLTCHAGGHYFVDRVMRGRQLVRDTYLNIIGGIQPKVAKKAFAAAEEGADDGFFERFGLLCCPEIPPWPGVKDEVQDRDLKRAYAEACIKLAKTRWADELPDGHMRFDDQAQDRFLAWYDIHMRTRGRGKEAEKRPEHGFMTKAPGLVARLAIIFHLFRWACDEAAKPHLINLASLEPAIGIFERYCAPMYARACKAFGEREVQPNAQRLCDYIRKKKPTKLRIADITKLDWSGGMADRQPVIAAFQALEDIDWLRPFVGTSGPRGGRPADHWTVNPKVLAALA